MVGGLLNDCPLIKGSEARAIKRAFATLKIAEKILGDAGLFDAEFKLLDILSAEKEINECISICTKIGTQFSCEMDGDMSVIREFSNETIIVANSLEIGAVSISYCAAGRAQLTHVEKERATLLGEISQIGWLEPGNGMPIDAFVEQCARKAKAELRVIMSDGGSQISRS